MTRRACGNAAAAAAQECRLPCIVPLLSLFGPYPACTPTSAMRPWSYQFEPRGVDAPHAQGVYQLLRHCHRRRGVPHRITRAVVGRRRLRNAADERECANRQLAAVDLAGPGGESACRLAWARAATSFKPATSRSQGQLEAAAAVRSIKRGSPYSRRAAAIPRTPPAMLRRLAPCLAALRCPRRRCPPPRPPGRRTPPHPQS